MDYHAAECCFGTLFIWRKFFDTYWAVVHGSLIIKVTSGGKSFILPPFGGVNEDLPIVIESLREYFGHKPFELHGVYESTIERFRRYLRKRSMVLS